MKLAEVSFYDSLYLNRRMEQRLQFYSFLITHTYLAMVQQEAHASLAVLNDKTVTL
jgi:hypothetical protein